MYFFKEFNIILYIIIFTIISYTVASPNKKPYEVYWLEGTSVVPISGHKQTVDIVCYQGATKNLLSLWQTVKFNLKISNDEFRQYMGGSPEEVYQLYNEDSYGWSVLPFQSKPYKVVQIDLYNSTCMCVKSQNNYTIELQIIRVDIWRITLMAMGIALILASRALSSNPVFFYLCGVLIGVCASFMVLVYYLSKFLPGRTLTYGIMLGGWTVGVYLFQQIWENLRTIILNYQTHMFWYTVVVGFASFLICYRIGPPQDRRSQNIVMWTLQVVGMFMIFSSSDYQEAATAIIVISFAIKYFPTSVLRHVQNYWHKHFPPKPRLLTSEEYYEEGARETKDALDNLRKYCSSPDCAQWRIMLKLNDSKRFASFVEGDSHLSDSEILDYESYAFSLERTSKPNNRISTTHEGLEISDDDSSASEDDIN